jgi:hypothetical protein
MTTATAWDEMFARLAAFKRDNGHCLVPTIYVDDATLGRWVAAQRYRGRTGDLPPERVKKLDELGFVWSPADRAWKDHYARLLEYRAAHGNCDVPEVYEDDQMLANWVQRQRIAKRRGRLPAEREELLDRVGFRWAVYKAGSEERPPRRVKPGVAEQWCKRPDPERLYRVGHGEYVQSRAEGPAPAPVRDYERRHNGEPPPYIPLPRERTIFYLGESGSRSAKLTWDGSGPLPPAVLRYVRRNDVLPPHE